MRNMEIPRCYSKGITASCEAITDADAGTMSNENDKAKLKAEIDALREYDPERLRHRYRELTGADAATFGARFLQRRCSLGRIPLGHCHGRPGGHRTLGGPCVQERHTQKSPPPSTAQTPSTGASWGLVRH